MLEPLRQGPSNATMELDADEVETLTDPEEASGFPDEATVQVGPDELFGDDGLDPWRSDFNDSEYGRDHPTILTSALDDDDDEFEAQATSLVLGDDGMEPAVKRKFEGQPPLGEGKATTRLMAVTEMSQTIHSERSLAVILEEVCSTITNVTGADRCAVLLKDPETEQLRAAAIHIANAEQASLEFRVSRTIVREPLRDGTSILSSDAAHDERFERRDSALLEQVRSVMCAPLQTRGEILGVIYVDSLSFAEVFEETDLALVATIGQQAGNAVERTRLVDDLENLFVGAMFAITASVEAKDAYTRGHAERVTTYALMISNALGLSSEQRDVIELGGLLHDVGKIGIPELVLCKPGALTGDEYETMKRHPTIGADIISNMPELDRLVPMGQVVDAVRYHHERIDGAGYPGGLAGHAIPLAARVLSVADCLDALTTDRPYRRASSFDAALDILQQEKGKQFDAEIVDAIAGVLKTKTLPDQSAVRGRFRLHPSAPAALAKVFADKGGPSR